MELLSYTETPIQEIEEPFLEEAGVRLLIKREDQSHPLVSGNKWWKLKYNLLEAIKEKKETLLTFGGAFSNHIFATAAAANELGIKSIGIIRGEEKAPLNPTLAFAKENGMQLKYVSRENYRQKTDADFIEKLREEFGDFYLIPEGGTNGLALKGCEEFARQILAKIDFDYLCLPVGTGGTMAGIIEGLKDKKKVMGFSVLKGGEFLEEEVNRFLQNRRVVTLTHWQLEHRFHFGGYGKTTATLNQFMSSQMERHRLPLDHVYTAKMLFGVLKMIAEGSFKKSTTIMVLHTGGLQSRAHAISPV